MIINNHTTLNITLAEFDNPSAKWGRNIVVDPETIPKTTSYFYSNLPIYLQKAMLNDNGEIDQTKLETFFNNRVDVIITKIVENRKILNYINLDDFGIDNAEKFRNSIYQTIDFMLRQGYQLGKTTGTSLSTASISIDTPLSGYTKLYDFMGDDAYNCLLSSKIHLYTLDAKGRLYFNGHPIYAHFATGEILQTVPINTADDDALLTRKAIAYEIGNAISKSRLEILNADEILDMSENFDAFIKANRQDNNPDQYTVIDINYNGNDQLFLNPNVFETYIFDGNNYLRITSNIEFRQAIQLIADNLGATISTKADDSIVLKRDGSVPLDATYIPVNAFDIMTKVATEGLVKNSIDPIKGNNWDGTTLKDIVDKVNLLTTKVDEHSPKIDEAVAGVEDYYANKAEFARVSDLNGINVLIRLSDLPTTIASSADAPNGILIDDVFVDISAVDKSTLANGVKVIAKLSNATEDYYIEDSFNDGSTTPATIDGVATQIRISPTRIIIRKGSTATNAEWTALKTKLDTLVAKQLEQIKGASGGIVDQTARTQIAALGPKVISLENKDVVKEDGTTEKFKDISTPITSKAYVDKKNSDQDTKITDLENTAMMKTDGTFQEFSDLNQSSTNPADPDTYGLTAGRVRNEITSAGLNKANTNLSNVNVGAANAGKFLKVAASGGVEEVDLPTKQWRDISSTWKTRAWTNNDFGKEVYFRGLSGAGYFGFIELGFIAGEIVVNGISKLGPYSIGSVSNNKALIGATNNFEMTQAIFSSGTLQAASSREVITFKIYE